MRPSPAIIQAYNVCEIKKMAFAPSAVDAGVRLRLDRVGTEKLFPAAKPNEASANSLIVCSAAYGLFFVVSNTDIKAFSTQQLAEHFRTGTGLTSVDAKVSQPVQALCLNSDDSLFAAVVHSNTHGSFVYLYEIGVFNPALNHAPRPFTDIRLTSAGDEFAVELQFNPVIQNSFASISSTGALTIRELLDANSGSSGYRITASVHNANAAAICWSPKGKQLCYITRDNSAVVQIKPDGSPARRIELPPTELMRDLAPVPHTKKKIIWLSTYEFMLNTQVNPNDLQYSLLHVIAPKDVQQLRIINYHDVCYGSDDQPHASWYYSLISQWGLLLATSSSSVEVAVLRNESNFAAGGGAEAAARWQQLTPDDTCRAELPYGDDQNSVGVPCGLTVDFSNNMTNDGTEPYVLWPTTSGDLHVYKLTYMPTDLLAPAGLQRVPSLRSGPVLQPLPAVSDRQRQALTAAPTVQPAAPPPTPAPLVQQPTNVPNFTLPGNTSSSGFSFKNTSISSSMLQQPDNSAAAPSPFSFGAGPAPTTSTPLFSQQPVTTTTTTKPPPLFTIPSTNNAFGGSTSASITAPTALPPSTSASNYMPNSAPAATKTAKPADASLVPSTSGVSTADQQRPSQNAARVAGELEKIINIVDKFGEEFRTVTNVIANESIFADVEQVSSAFGTQQQSSSTISVAELYKLVKPFDSMLTMNDKRLRDIGDRVVQQAADVDAVLAQLDVWLVALQAQSAYGGSMFAQLLRQQPATQHEELRQYRFAALQRAIVSNENVLNRLHAELDNAFALYGAMNYNDPSNPVLSLSGQPLPASACKQLLRTTRRALKLNMLLQRVDAVRKAITVALETCAGLNSRAAAADTDDADEKSQPEVGRREWLGMLNEYRQLVIQARDKLHATHQNNTENADDLSGKSRNSSGGIEKLASRLSKLDFGCSSTPKKPRGFASTDGISQHKKSMQSRPAWLVQLLRTRINDEDCSTVPCSYADEGATALVDAYKKSIAAVSADANRRNKPSASHATENDDEFSQLTNSMTRLCELQEALVRNIQEAALSNKTVDAVSTKPPSRISSLLQPTSTSLSSTSPKNLSSSTTPTADIQSLSNLLSQRQPAVKAVVPSTPKVAVNNVASVFGSLGSSENAQAAATKLTSRAAVGATPATSSFLSAPLAKNNTTNTENGVARQQDDPQGDDVSFTVKRSSPLLSTRSQPPPPSTPTPTTAPSLFGHNNTTSDAGSASTKSTTFSVPQTAVMKTAEPLQDATKSPFFGGFSPAAAPASVASTTAPARTSTVTFDASTKFGAAPSPAFSPFGTQPSAATTTAATPAATLPSFSSFMPPATTTTAAAPTTATVSSSPFGALLGFNLGGSTTAAAAPTTATSIFSTPQQTVTSTGAAPPAPAAAAVASSPFSLSSNNTATNSPFGGGGGLFGSPFSAASTPLFGQSTSAATTKPSLFGTPTPATTTTAAIPSFSLSGLASNFGKSFPAGSSTESQAPTTTSSSSLFGAGSFFAGGASTSSAPSPFAVAPAPTAAAAPSPFSANTAATPAFGSGSVFGSAGFGAGTSGGFGSKPVFGGGSGGLFGAAPATGNVFGTSSAFGGPDSSKTTGPSFADIAAQATQQPAQPAVLGGGSGSYAPFGSTVPATGFGLFGSSANSTTGSGLFGSPSSSFGGGGGVFGQTAAAKVDTPLFGGQSATQPKPSFSQYRG